MSGSAGPPAKGVENSTAVMLSRSKLDRVSSKLSNSDLKFAGYLLSAAHVSPEKQAAAKRKVSGKAQQDQTQHDDDDDNVAVRPDEHVGDNESFQPPEQTGLDITTDDVSGSLLHWRAPSRAYVWGRAQDGQLGCGTVNAQAAISRLLCPMRVNNIKLADAHEKQGEAAEARDSTQVTPASTYVDTVPIRVACGKRVTMLVDNKRRLWAMGEGYFGRGKKERVHIPTVVGGLDKHAIVEVAVGKGFMLACTVDGVALVWGENEGMAALEVTADKGYRRDINFLTGPRDPVSSPASGGQPEKDAAKRNPGDPSTGFVTAGTAQGHPLGFEPGSPYKVPQPRPMTKLNREQVISVAAGEAHLVALCSSGKVYTWGGGSSGATGQGTTQPTWIPTALVLRPPQRSRVGQSLASEPLASTVRTGGKARSFASLTARERRRSIAEVDGARMAGVLGLGKVVRAVGHSKEDNNTAGTQAEEAKYACAISAGSHHTAVLARDGTVHVMGFAESGRLGLGHDRPEPVVTPTALRVPGINHFTAIACGGSHTLFVSADGRVFASGDNSFGQCGLNTRKARLESKVFERLPGGGEVVHAERRVLVPRQIFTPVFGDTIVVKVAAGMRHSACVDLQGAMWTWGLNEEGSCGSGDEVTSPEPVRVSRLREVRVIQASLGDAHTGAIVMRGRHIASGNVVNQLDDEDATGQAMTLEPGLPLNLRRERRQQLNVRRKAIAFCFARKRRLARLARKRLLRRMISQHMVRAARNQTAYTGALAAAAAATDTENAVEAVQTSAKSPSSPRTGREAFDAPSARFGVARLSYGNRPVKELWELDPDSAEYGKNSAASVIQAFFRRSLTAQQLPGLGGAVGGLHGRGRAAGEAGVDLHGHTGRSGKSSAVVALSKLHSMRGARSGTPASQGRAGSSQGQRRGGSVPPVVAPRGRAGEADGSGLEKALQKMGFSSETLTDTL